jgi:hypothetical protein
LKSIKLFSKIYQYRKTIRKNSGIKLFIPFITMKKNVLLSLLTMVFIALGCKKNDPQNAELNNSAKDSIHQADQEDKVEGKEEVAGKLVLNNGNKWQSNPETTEGIHKMQAFTDEYLRKGSTDNKILSEKLEKEFTVIIQKCTMSGMAHDQLHLFLLPLKAKIDNLKETQEDIAVKEIQSDLNNYDSYFQ